MKFRLLFPILVLAFSVSALTAQTANPAEEALNRAVADRMNYLESVYGFVFDRQELCGVSFGIPPEGDPSFRAQYVPNLGAIYLNTETILQFARARVFYGERVFEGPPRLSKVPSLVTSLDHELGHAHADQVSRRIGNGVWPDVEALQKSNWRAICGTIMVSEGIAGFFGYNPEFGKVRSAKSLPVETDYKYWVYKAGNKLYYTARGQHALYAYGKWLVEPILRRFGERGIEYLVTHPLVFTDGKVRKPAVEYRKEALRYLAKNAKK